MEGKCGWQLKIVGEQSAVEVGDGVDAEVAAGTHRLKERPHLLGQSRRVVAALREQRREEAGGRLAGLGQEADVFGEEAEDKFH